MNIFKRIWKRRSDLRSLPWTIYFNFHYLPLKQAWKLPIILYKPELLKMKGKIIIDVPKIKTGMIRFGFRMVSIYPNNGLTWENHGGTVTFQGKCIIGNNSFISVGSKGKIMFDYDFLSTASLKIISYREISFGKKTRIGWDSIVTDTNFHPLLDITTGNYKKASGPIKIGDYNWIGMKCIVMHSVETPERCIFGLGSIITRGSVFESYSIHGGYPLKVLTKNVMRDYEKDKENYD